MRGRTIAMTVVGLVLVAGAAVGARQVLRHREPESALVVDPDPIEFPTARWGERLQRSFTLTNRSDRPVFMKDPRFSCGCFRLVHPAPSSTLQPGETVTFDLVMESAASGSPGTVRKEVTIESDDPVVPKLVVPIVGHLTAFRTIEPSSLTLGNVDPAAEPVERRVAVRGGSGFTVEVVKAEADDRLRVATDVRPAEGGSDVVVRAAKGAPAGPIASAVRLTLAVREKGGDPETVIDSVWVTGRVK